MDIEVNVRERVLRPVGEVFGAFVDPSKMSNYFISSATGSMTPNSKVVWSFADVGAKVPVDVIDVDPDREIVFEWNACGPRTRVTIRFSADVKTTVVTITESKFPMDDAGVKRALGQNAGWTYTLCCLKAYLQHGINLRVGLNKRLTDVR